MDTLMDALGQKQLLDRAAEGDRRAFEHLIKRHYMLVYTVSYKWCGIKEDAEDIAQEVFVKVARKIRSFKQKSSFTTWLYRITLNTAKDFHRKSAARGAYESEYVREQNIAKDGTAADNPVSSAELYEAVRKLPAKMREAVVLVFGQGLSHREAARALRCAETTVSWRVFQAKKKLRKLLEQGV
jgi:RNA polymerase sigma-70 factor (ECF subfamily)